MGGGDVSRKGIVMSECALWPPYYCRRGVHFMINVVVGGVMGVTAGNMCEANNVTTLTNLHVH